MPRHVAFLRGVAPTNAKMAELKRCFEATGFTTVKTVLSSGNVVFDACATTEAALERKAETAMARNLGRSFYTIVRPIASLEALLKADPFAPFAVTSEEKRVVTFFRKTPAPLPTLPLVHDGARIVALRGRELFTAYIPNKNGPGFMELIEKNFGRNQTTRTWGTLEKCVRA
jgi:uncharacterized protein (DUF1697 family)